MNVQFDDRDAQRNAMYNQLQQSGNQGGLTGFLMKRGMTEKKANTVLISTGLVALALMIYFLSKAF